MFINYANLISFFFVCNVYANDSLVNATTDDKSISINDNNNSISFYPRQRLKRDLYYSDSDWADDELILRIKPNEEMKVANSFPYLLTHYEVMNLGRSLLEVEIYINLYWPSSYKMVKRSLTPLETEVVKSTPHYGLNGYVIVRNPSSSTVGYAYVTGPYSTNTYLTWTPNTPASSEPPELFDMSELLMEISTSLVGKIPYAGTILGPLVTCFWPKKEQPDIWSQIEKKVEDLIKKVKVDILKKIMIHEIAPMKARIQQLEEDLLRKQSADMRESYMQLARDMIGFSAAVLPNNENDAFVRFISLPFYTMAVLLKVWFYTIGIEKPKNFGLNDKDVADLEVYNDKTIREAETTLPKILTDRLEAEYNDSTEIRFAFYNFMNIRNTYSKYGSEYLDIIRTIAKNEPFVRWRATYIAAFYNSNDHYKNAVFMQENPFHQLYNVGRLTKIKTYWDNLLGITLYIFKGIKLYYDGNVTITHGSDSGNMINTLDLADKQINKLRIRCFKYGDIATITFYFDDKSEFSTHGEQYFNFTDKYVWDGGSEYVLSSLNLAYENAYFLTYRRVVNTTIRFDRNIDSYLNAPPPSG